MTISEQARRIRRRVIDKTVKAPLRKRTASLRDREFMRELVGVTDNFGDVTWLGYPIWQNVLDVWNIQEAIHEIRPALILETGTNRGGSAMFYAHLFDLLGAGRVVTVDVERLHDLEHPRIEFIVGSSVGDEALSRMKAAV